MLSNKLANLNLLNIKNPLKLCNRLYANNQIKFNRYCIISTAGSQCSGKTTLTEALRQVNAEQLNLNLPSAINSGAQNSVFYSYYVDDTRITHIDTDSIPPKNLLTSSFGTDIGLIVIDASKGLDYQTKEHILLFECHNVNDFIVFLNKTDLNEDDQLKELMIDEIKCFFKQRNLNLTDDSIICGSALNASNNQAAKQSIIDVLKLIEMKSKQIKRDEQLKEPALFSIKRSHSKLNKGTEVTGFMRQGLIKKGDIVNICGFDRLFKTRIQEIESFKEQLDHVQPGISAALLLKSIKREDINRGMLIMHPGNNNIHITDHFKAKFNFFSKDEQKNDYNLKDDTTLQIFARTFDLRTIIKIENDEKELKPGESGTVTFKVRRVCDLIINNIN